MYDVLRKDLLIALSKVVEDPEILKAVIDSIDVVMENYNVERKTTALVVVGKDKVEEAAKLFLICKKIQGCTDGTIYNLRLAIEGFVNYCNCPLKDIDANVIRRYLLLYKTNHKVSDVSLDKLRCNLALWFAWMQNEGYINRNPMSNVSQIKYVKKHKPSVDQKELESLREACRNDQERCLVEVLYSTGCRISEALSIKLSDIKFDLPYPECQVIGKGSKERTVYFSPRSISAIRKYIKSRRHESEYLFINERGGEKMRSDNAEKKFRELRVLAGLESKNLTPHTMRHTFATQTGKTAPVQVVQKLLGHTRIDTTMIYMDTSQEDARAYHSKAI